MTTVAELVEATRDHLYGNSRQMLTTLDGAVSSTTATTVTLTSVDDVARGAFLAVDDELLYVSSVNTSTRVATVIRGRRATTAATHADDAEVEIQPIVPRYRIKRALQEEIRSWPPDVYRVTSVNLDTAADTSGYDLTGISSDFHAILDVQLGPRSGVDDNAVVRPSWHLIRNADTSIYASGSGIVLTGYVPDEARDIRVIVSRPFDTSTWTDATEVESTVGLASSAIDIPPMGAAARLNLGRDIKRSFGEGQGESRRAEEIPPGFSGSVATFLRREVTRRLGEEAVRLRTIYGIRRS